MWILVIVMRAHLCRLALAPSIQNMLKTTPGRGSRRTRSYYQVHTLCCCTVLHSCWVKSAKLHHGPSVYLNCVYPCWLSQAPGLFAHPWPAAWAGQAEEPICGGSSSDQPCLGTCGTRDKGKKHRTQAKCFTICFALIQMLEILKNICLPAFKW